MKKLIVCAVLFFFIATAYSQHRQTATKSYNNVYMEVLGNGGLYSVNYERMVRPVFALRIGVGAWQNSELFGEGKTSIITVPVLGSYLFGKRRGKLEVGGGFLLGHEKFATSIANYGNSTIFDLTAVIGYRLQPSKKGFVFRAGLTPFYALNEENPYPGTGFTLSAGISAGYAF